MSDIDSLEHLQQLLARLPGVGRRSAARMAVFIARRRDGYLKELEVTLQQVAQEIAVCRLCGSLTPVERDPCRLCTDPRRDNSILCVVEDPGDIDILERAGIYRGRYHALGGRLAPTRVDQQVQARVQQLAARIRENGVKEVLIALNSDVESDATAAFIAEKVANTEVKLTRLARGIPAGSGLAFADAITLEAAVKNRTAY